MEDAIGFNLGKCRMAVCTFLLYALFLMILWWWKCLSQCLCSVCLLHCTFCCCSFSPGNAESPDEDAHVGILVQSYYSFCTLMMPDNWGTCTCCVILEWSLHKGWWLIWRDWCFSCAANSYTWALCLAIPPHLSCWLLRGMPGHDKQCPHL